MEDRLGTLEKRLNRTQWEKTWRTAPRPSHRGRVTQSTLEEAEALHDAGDYQAALKVLEIDNNTEIDPSALATRGLAKHALRKLDCAEEDYFRAEKLLMSQLAAVKGNRSAILLDRQQNDEALALSQEALQIDPSTPSAWGNGFAAYARQGRLNEFFDYAEDMKRRWCQWKENRAFILFLKDNVDLRKARSDPRFKRAFGKEIQDTN